MKATIWHNPNCGTSRKTLDILRASGADVTVIKYLEAPPSRARLAALYQRAGLRPREGLRAKEAAAQALIAAGASDDAILDAMVADPILIERPLVETDKGAALCRPQERVQALL